MRAHQRVCLFAFLFSLALPFAWLFSAPAPFPRKSAPTPNQDAPKPLPPQIAKVWRDAGVQVGWMRISNDLDADDYFRDDKAPTGELPAFRYGTPSCVPLTKQPPWKAGVLVKLPDPGVPFALEMWATPLNDVGLKELAHLKSMRMLKLAITLVSDAGMKELAGLKSLRVLDIGDNGWHTNVISDAGLKHLAGLTNLQSLNLHDTKVTDAGLKELVALKNLQRLYLFATETTREGVAALQKELPKCKIH
jgi:internalin A